MSGRSDWWLRVAAVASLVLAGCESPPTESELSMEMRREAAQDPPPVSGPYREFAVDGKREEILKTVRETLKEAGVVLVSTGGTMEATWLFGRSQAGRSALVEILPIYPGRFILKVTVEGRDLLTRQLLDHLGNDIAGALR